MAWDIHILKSVLTSDSNIPRCPVFYFAVMHGLSPHHHWRDPDCHTTVAHAFSWPFQFAESSCALGIHRATSLLFQFSFFLAQSTTNKAYCDPREPLLGISRPLTYWSSFVMVAANQPPPHSSGWELRSKLEEYGSFFTIQVKCSHGIHSK